MIAATATSAILNMKNFGNGLMSKLDHGAEEDKDETYAFQERQRPQERPQEHRQERYDPRQQAGSVISHQSQQSQQYRPDPRQQQYQQDPRQQGQRQEYRQDYRQQDNRR
jgi:hypothetical protein